MEEVFIEVTNLSKGNQENSIIEKLTEINKESTKFDFNDLSLSTDCEKYLIIKIRGKLEISTELMQEINKYNLQSFYEKRLAKRTYFFKKIPNEEIMKWSPKLITEPLSKLPSNMKDYAVQLFKNLMSYMGDRKSSKPVIEHVKKHLNFTLNASIELKDEVYLQVLKQITDNPNYDRMIKGWIFLSLLSSCFTPSLELFYSLLNYLVSNLQTISDKIIIQRSNYIIVRLIKTFEKGRKYIPSDEEIFHIESMKPIMFPVYFFSNTHTLVPTESYTTVKDLKATIMRKLKFNLSRIPYYCLYEICDKKDILEERFLEDSELIFDIFAIWEKEKKEEQFNIIDFKLYLKIQLYYTYAEDDIDTVTMVYVQTLYEVQCGRYNLTEQEVIALASLQLLIDYKVSHETAYQALQKYLFKYIPQDYYEKHSCAYWIQRIMELYSGLRTSSILEAKLTYLDQIKSNPFWQSHQFNVKYSVSFNQTNAFPDECILAIKPYELTIFDNCKNLLENFPYNQIASWGVSSEVIVIVVSRMDGQIIKYYFESNQTKILHYLIASYTNLIVGKSVEEAMSLVRNTIIRKNASNETVKNKKRESERSRICTFYRMMRRKVYYDI